MAVQTEIELDFADGSYLFALRLPQLAELQEKCGAGIFTIYGRVLKGRYVLQSEVVGIASEGEAYSQDVYETIRLALIGGGKGRVGEKDVEVSTLKARELIERYIIPAPMREAWGLAAAILAAKIEGYDPGPNVAPPAGAAKPKRGSTKASTPKM